MMNSLPSQIKWSKTIYRIFRESTNWLTFIESCHFLSSQADSNYNSLSRKLLSKINDVKLLKLKLKIEIMLRKKIVILLNKSTSS